MIRETKSGEVVERSFFPVGNATKPRRGKRKGATPPRKQDQNDKSAARRLARVIHCNFKPGDLFITLKYGPEKLAALKARIIGDEKEVTPDSLREYAIADRDRFIRRIRRTLERSGQKLRYIASTSDVDSSTGEYVKVHHHLILPKEIRKLVEKNWPVEYTNFSPLDHRKDHTALAEYIVKQARRQPDAKKYTVSQGMKQPTVTEKIVLIREELKPPRGAQVTFKSAYDPMQPYQYVRSIKPEGKKKRGGKRE